MVSSSAMVAPRGGERQIEISCNHVDRAATNWRKGQQVRGLIRCLLIIGSWREFWRGLESVTIIVLSVVPANDRPVSGAGHLTEHFAAFAPVAVAFAIGYYRLSLLRLCVIGFFVLRRR